MIKYDHAGLPPKERFANDGCDIVGDGEVTYTAMGQVDTKIYQCLCGCVYKMESSARFCFAKCMWGIS